MDRINRNNCQNVFIGPIFPLPLDLPLQTHLIYFPLVPNPANLERAQRQHQQRQQRAHQYYQTQNRRQHQQQQPPQSTSSTPPPPPHHHHPPHHNPYHYDGHQHQQQRQPPRSQVLNSQHYINPNGTTMTVSTVSQQSAIEANLPGLLNFPHPMPPPPYHSPPQHHHYSDPDGPSFDHRDLPAYLPYHHHELFPFYHQFHRHPSAIFDPSTPIHFSSVSTHTPTNDNLNINLNNNRDLALPESLASAPHASTA
ncbi:hypothetical protein DFA_06798 [Cavenderia fasciculata]|uniref:Uncharacterized protein n=1 Tax=Cavenderia fasciculata TaxID=261658 RepID=F4Q2B1_CACFS|nr:uncharacterized protein DFA_06798 [Cavenderia fasciculata]EGG18131.1 hypothetical protein DFA_06798 [Cavenderia fasciculata]|eukprot:XP_004366172.1 hypothetical protein DFA_06798 [Cavenderia fasciculata]